MTREPGCAASLKAQMTRILRAMYGSPARGPATILEAILGDKERSAQWRAQLRDMVLRVQQVGGIHVLLQFECYFSIKVRAQLRRLMEERCPGRDWSSITTQTGMFWYSGLTRDQGFQLAHRHVYM